MSVRPAIRPTRAEVDLDALLHNLGVIRALSPKADVLAVVKANAYGHGAVTVALTLENAGVGFFGVALVEEGLELREAGVKAPILVLGGAYEGGYEALVAGRLTPVVFLPQHLAGLGTAARAAKVRAVAHLKLDTGMGRIGVRISELDAFLTEAARHPEVELEGILSHFASADLANAEMTQEQLRRFREGLRLLEARGIHPRYRHLSNSAGVMSLPEARDGVTVNLVRPGLMLYGASPAARLEAGAKLRPVLRWETAITQVKTVPAGTPISYGGTWIAPRESVIATLPVGYADGYFRSLSNRGEVLIRGGRAKVVGRVCMDMTMVDVTDLPGVREGDPAVLLGSQGNDTVTVDELAGWMGTISYEVLCGVSARVPRIALRGGTAR